MAPAKRTASKAAAGRPQKVAKTAAPPKEAKVAKVAAPPKVAKPRFAILDELRHGGVAKSCLDMLVAALPHVLETPKEERHQFQHSVLDSLDDISGKERARRGTVLEEAQDASRNFDLELSAAADQAAAANAEEAARKEKKVESEANLRTIAGAADAASKAWKEVKSKAEEAAGNVDKAGREKESFVTKVAELWPALRDATFEKKDWRARQRAIAQLMLLVEPVAPESLSACLPLALKEGLDSRGSFGKMVVEEGERVLDEHTQQLESAIAAAKTAVDECGGEATRAETLAKEADVARDQAQEDCIKVANEWVTAQEESFRLTQFIKKADSTRAEHEAAVQQAKEVLEALDAAMAEFKAQVEPPAAAPIEVEPEPLAVAEDEAEAEAKAEAVLEPPAAAEAEVAAAA